ncbi:Toll/interleukin-1 receptor-like protein [Glycine soja]
MTKYGAFMSFRGTETCYDIAASLYKALLREGVHTFNDDQSLNIGEPIQPALYNAIEGSRVFYVVISKGYASSIGCLQELARICYCVETSPRRVLPIFYDVDPSEVRKQIGCFGKAFAKHEERFRGDNETLEEVQRWREALTRVANRSGWVIGNESYCVHIPEMVRKKHLSLLPSTSGIALASSTIMHAIRTYDVFVSFRGLDTRNNFAALLLQALHRNGIDAFNDNVHVMKAWICKNIETSTRRILPIFYVVDPLKVQKQSGCYEKAFLDHEERFRGAKEREQVWRWRKALKQVSHLPCMHIQNELQHLQQAEIEEILQEIINILNSKSSSLPNDDLVGMKSIWISTLDRLRDNKSRNIMNVLQISYDDSEEKD